MQNRQPAERGRTAAGSQRHPAHLPRARWLKLRYLAPIAVCVWGTYYYLHTLHPQLVALQQQQQALSQQLQTLQAKNNELAQQARNLQDDAYVAKYAGEHFNLVMPGQVPFVVH
ncbi:MAG: septum formation initiator family protein [Thermoflavifilum sp.]|nr:septum formation initiator family protein [Thermoflavifilum sp.]MCL6513740.1 septum formation initiator family protein [Alicyclobacillus sp.]